MQDRFLKKISQEVLNEAEAREVNGKIPQIGVQRGELSIT